MSNRLRIVGWMVQPVAFSDDGETLTPVPVQAIQIPAAEWPAFVEGAYKLAVDSLREQVEGPPELAP